MRIIDYIYISAFIMVLVCSCSLQDEKDNAKMIAETFLNERIVNGGFEGKKDTYSKLFWGFTTDTEWNDLKSKVDIKLGNLEKYTLISCGAKTGTFVGRPPGTYVILLYRTEYEKGVGQEKLSMYKMNDDDKFKIIGHRIETNK